MTAPIGSVHHVHHKFKAIKPAQDEAHEHAKHRVRKHYADRQPAEPAPTEKGTT